MKPIRPSIASEWATYRQIVPEAQAQESGAVLSLRHAFYCGAAAYFNCMTRDDPDDKEAGIRYKAIYEELERYMESIVNPDNVV